MSNMIFRPVKGTDRNIQALEKVEGSLYFATDSGKIYLDTDGQRIPMGGGGGSADGASVFYGSAEELVEENELYNIEKTKVEGYPRINDLILNSDGGFYKVEAVGDEYYTCTLLSVSGTGGGPAVEKIPEITRLALDNYSLINGAETYFDLEAHSFFIGERPVDETMRVSVSLGTKQSLDDDYLNVYWSTTLIYRTAANDYFETYGVGPGYIKDRIEIGSKLRDSATSYLVVQVLQGEHDGPSKAKGLYDPITTSVLELKQKAGYSPATRHSTGGFTLSYNVNGAIDKKIKFTFDGVEIKPTGNQANPEFSSYEDSSWQPSFQIPAGRYDEDGTPIPGTATHGYHTVEVQLCQMLGNSEGTYVKPLHYELAVIGNDIKLPPVIWLGDYQDVYYTYDSIQIPFLVWDPEKTTSATDVHLYKNDIELEGSPLEITEFNEYNYWEIADADFGQQNKYQLSCGETTDRFVKREIRFTVEVDPVRDMSPEQSDLMLNFNAAGRTNNESPAKRQTWSYKLGDETKYATFNNFNWSNNGWAMDKSISTSYLCISNGAQLTIPYQEMIFASNATGKQSHSVEMQFKVRNIQKYEKLISNITRYKFGTAKDAPTDEQYYKDFIDPNQKEYDNYDAYLQYILSPEKYELLTYWKVEKIINVNNIVGGLYDYDPDSNSIVGFCIGTQDAFFSNGTDTVNIDFVENELVNISFVYQDGLKLLQIYINGCITGVIKSTLNNEGIFKIDSKNFVFNSQNCDLDLYKIRVYSKNLTVNQIVKNFAADRKDVNIFDQNNLAIENEILQEYQLIFNNVKSYIEKNPNKPLMPYIIFDTGNINSKLPYSKKDSKNITVEFVNVPLEQAYMSGKLENLAMKDGLYDINTTDQKIIDEAVKTYYKHHCPSFITNIRANDKVTFEVQGTSSEFYPRRNYKIKTKIEGNFNWKDNAELDPEEQTEEGGAFTESEALNIFMNNGPFAEAYQEDQRMVLEDPHKVGYETTRLVDGWYMNNYTNATDRWTMKVDYMESSGSYNAGFASLVGNSYTKHPLQDYLGVMNNTSKLKPIVKTTVCDDDGMRWEDYRTSLLGFPVMAFWRREGNDGNPIYIFIGYYRMLLDKSSTQVLGFKTPKSVTNKLFPIIDEDGKPGFEAMRNIAECWEFSNNARGYCSYRDPWKRVELSFKPPVGVKNEYTSYGAPIVANNFEYRYHSKDDYIDVLYNFDEAEQEDLNEVAKKLGLPIGSIIQGDRASGTDALLTTHRNWEKVCKWLWSTNLEDVVSQGIYTKIPVGNVEYQDNGNFFIINEDGEYEVATGPFNEEYKYYIYKRNDEGEMEYEDEEKTKPLYEPVDATIADYLYTPGKFYYLAAGINTEDEADDVYAISYDTYDGSIDYYQFEPDNFNTLNSRFDLLVAPVDIETETFDAEGPIIPVTSNHEYDETTKYFTKGDDGFTPWTYVNDESFKTAVSNGLYYRDHYYTWHGTDYDAFNPANCVVVTPGKPTGAVRIVEVPNGDDWGKGLYYKANPVTYVNKIYTHDTREYRVAKFTNEFEKHFDPEYVATYFIMTEVMECYDSRGKNCMMASWGPKEVNGEYIWYPIFYDIDTQLGINNTGIPSFAFNVDATEENNFSTSDSILWNNFYKFFKKTWMIPKYQNLRDINTTKFDSLLERDLTTSKAPLQDVDYIEKWYNFDPEVTKNIACEGDRPLIATNLDLYFKYITITNNNAKAEGVAHLDDAGNYSDPDDGTYFYALQGDRSQSRRQFLTNRLEYIDSWLTQKNYARGGANRLWGRISANNTSGTDVHSDKWVENNNNPYWVDKEFGTKSHEFDSEYWLELKPIRSSYVTAGDDSANYPSEKYDGVNKMYFVLDELENGIRTSNNYPEQLLYIYGTNQMSDFGDLSKMYWTEFKLEGEANKLTRLKLGHDGLDENDLPWYNRKLNNIKLPALPLLKEANFCNINITADKKSLDLSSSEKLENFRATGSNINSISFAKGVALNTLYLPASVASLSLEQANLLTDLIINYEVPKKQGNELKATPGLYLENFFDEDSSSALKTINFKSGSLGYNSFTILNQLYKRNSGNVTMHEVNWCPYTKLTEGDVYEAGKDYYKDNGHYGFEAYPKEGETYNEKQFNAYVLSGLLYRDDGFGGRDKDNNFSTLVSSVNQDAITMLKDLYEQKTKFFNASQLGRPDITGIIYINNTDGIDEGVLDAKELEKGKIGIGNLQQYYPNLTFFFKEVNRAYSAKFVVFNEEDYSESYVKWSNGSTSPSVQKIQAYSDTAYFENPFELYTPKKEHYDFVGWSLNDYDPYDEEGNLLSSVITINNMDDWYEQALDKDTYDYTYYAIFEIHKYKLHFHSDDGTVVESIVEVPYGERAQAPIEVPFKDDSELDLIETYNFIGYSLSVGGKITDLNTIVVSSDEDFYANFERKDVYQSVHEDWFDVDKNGVITPNRILKGKITLPAKKNKITVTAIGSFKELINNKEQQFTHIFCLADSQITTISENAFNGVRSLKYFDYSPNTITTIGNSAFFQCDGLLSDDNFKLSTKLTTIGNSAFGNAFDNSDPTANPHTIHIPGCVESIGLRGFSNIFNHSGGQNDNRIQIGGPNDISKLNLNNPVLTDNMQTSEVEKFATNRRSISAITFYTNQNYPNGLASLIDSESKWTLRDIFLGNRAGQTDLAINFNIEKGM